MAVLQYALSSELDVVEADQQGDDSNSEVVDRSTDDALADVNSPACTPGTTGTPFVRRGEQRSQPLRTQSSPTVTVEGSSDTNKGQCRRSVPEN